MQRQQMVAHLVESVQYTNGKKVTTCTRPEADALESKQVMIYTDALITKSVFLGAFAEYFSYLYPRPISHIIKSGLNS